VALAFVGSAAGFFSDGILAMLVGAVAGFASGVGIGVILVAIYAKSDGRGQPLSVVPPVDAVLSSQLSGEKSRLSQADRTLPHAGSTEE
jgi:hypothetical protein